MKLHQKPKTLSSFISFHCSPSTLTLRHTTSLHFFFSVFLLLSWEKEPLQKAATWESILYSAELHQPLCQ